MDFGKLFLQRCQTHFVQGEGAAGEESPSAAKPKSLPDRPCGLFLERRSLRLAQFFPEMGSKVIKVLRVWGLSPLFYEGAQGAQNNYLFSRPLLFIGGKTLWVDSTPGFKFAQI